MNCFDAVNKIRDKIIHPKHTSKVDSGVCHTLLSSFLKLFFFFEKLKCFTRLAKIIAVISIYQSVAYEQRDMSFNTLTAITVNYYNVVVIIPSEQVNTERCSTH